MREKWITQGKGVLWHDCSQQRKYKTSEREKREGEYGKERPVDRRPDKTQQPKETKKENKNQTIAEINGKSNAIYHPSGKPLLTSRMERVSSRHFQDSKNVSPFFRISVAVLPALLPSRVYYNLAPVPWHGACAILGGSMGRRSGYRGDCHGRVVLGTGQILLGSGRRAGECCARLEVWLWLHGPDVNHAPIILSWLETIAPLKIFFFAGGV